MAFFSKGKLAVGGDLQQILADTPRGSWLAKNSAILVVHGIGNQLPLETLAVFAENLKKHLEEWSTKPIMISHICGCKDDPECEGVKIDSFIRLSVPGSTNYLDIYEYYWAHQTEDQATLGEVQRWIRSVAKRATKHYKSRELVGQQLKDRSVFWTKDGKFRPVFYRFTLTAIGSLIPGGTRALDAVFSALSVVPIVGRFFTAINEQLRKSFGRTLSNLFGDITIYNTSDEKSKHYKVRKKILNGAVSALTTLVERGAGTGDHAYGQIILCGHSLGSQISFDALNRLNQLVQLGQLKGIDERGIVDQIRPIPLDELIRGYVTFGSPLDKIAFFLQTGMTDVSVLRRQMLSNFNGFRQEDWFTPEERAQNSDVPLSQAFGRLLDNIEWINLHDNRDPISGQLHFYHSVHNYQAHLKPKLFTHSSYWTEPALYNHIIKLLSTPRTVTPLESTMPTQRAAKKVNA
jgi:hypothetical protein